MPPTAAPPAAPPPPPPRRYSDSPSVSSEASPYQQATKGKGSKNLFPMITNYGLSPQHQPQYGSSAYHDNPHHDDETEPLHNNTRSSMVNPHLRPNTGQTNAESGELLGSLREIASTLRWMTILTTITAILWEGFAIPMRLLNVFQIDKLVLGVYLGVFCVLILGVEWNTAVYQPALRDNFGFLYSPCTRGFTLLIMSSLCFSLLKSWLECLLGIAFGVVGIGYLYTYAKYPEYRRWQDYNESVAVSWHDVRQYWMNSDRPTNGKQRQQQSSIWANPEEAFQSFQNTTTAMNEARSLLHNV